MKNIFLKEYIWKVNIKMQKGAERKENKANRILQKKFVFKV